MAMEEGYMDEVEMKFDSRVFLYESEVLHRFRVIALLIPGVPIIIS